MKDLDEFLQGGAFRTALVARMLTDLHDDEPPYVAGSRIGPFLVTGIIGRGGSSVVYRAERHEGGFAQTVALKVGAGGPHWREMFEQERNLLARLTHPSIVPIFDGGETLEGFLWLAMPAVDGERIDRWCEQHDAGWKQRIGLLVTVCEAVHSAHQRRVVHRDLKPGNILVDSEGLPRILDFGISGLIGHRDPEGFVAMTPAFSSPEQESGGEITAATDVYLLGRVTQALLDGQRLPALAARNVQAIVARATQVDPARRYASAGEIAQDLAGVRKGLPARGVAWPFRWLAIYALHRRWPVVAVACAALVAIAAVSINAVVRVARERDHALRQERATLELSRFTSLLEDDVVGGPGGDKLSATSALEARQRALAGDTRGDPLVRSVLLLALGRAYNEIGRFEEAIPVLRQAAALSEPLGVEYRAELSQQRCELAWAYHYRGQSALAEEAVDASRKALAANGDPSSRERLAAVQCLALTLTELGYFRDAKGVIAEALTLSEQQYGRSSPEYFAARNASSELARRQFSPQRAFVDAEPVVADLVARLGADHPRALGAAIRLQAFVAERGDPVAASMQLRRLVELSNKPGQEYRYPRHSAAFYLGDSLRYQGHYAEAQAWFERAMAEIDSEGGAVRSPHYLADSAHVAELEWARGDLAAAEARLRGIVAATAKAAPASIDHAYYRMLLGSVLAARGDALDEAEPLLLDSLAAVTEGYGETSYPVARIHLGLARVAMRRDQRARVAAELAQMQWNGARQLPDEFAQQSADRNDLLAAQEPERDEAARRARESLAMLGDVLGVGHPRTALAQLSLAELVRDESPQEARLLLEQSEPVLLGELVPNAPARERMLALRAALKDSAKTP